MAILKLEELLPDVHMVFGAMEEYGGLFAEVSIREDFLFAIYRSLDTGEVMLRFMDGDADQYSGDVALTAFLDLIEYCKEKYLNYNGFIVLPSA